MSAAWWTGYVKSRALRLRLPAAAASALTVGLRSSSATLTRLRNGSRSWLSAGTELCVKIVAAAGSIPAAR